jgi:membrane-associated phospholipid phosphatase
MHADQHLLQGPIARGENAYSTPNERRRARPRALLILLAMSSGLLIFTLLDRPIWLVATADDIEKLKGRDWWQALRAAGYLPTWILVGVLFMLHDRTRDLRARLPGRFAWWQRGLLIFLGAALGGLAAEILKGIVRRERPGPEGIYVFDYAGMGREHVGLGLASSHTGTAFGACIMLGWLFPEARWPLLLLAAGCGFSRIHAGAHWTTDVYVAILLSYGVCLLLWRVLGPGCLTPRDADAPRS